MHWAGSHGLSAVRDELGDVIIDKPASAGYEKAPKVILQAHMDMVCVAAEGVHFDPLNDPIKIINDGKRSARMVPAWGLTMGSAWRFASTSCRTRPCGTARCG